MSEDRKHYNKDIPLAIHAKEWSEKTLEGRLDNYRDYVARKIIDETKEGFKSATFYKWPSNDDIARGYTNNIYAQVYEELATKGYKLDYSSDYLKVSWE